MVSRASAVWRAVLTAVCCMTGDAEGQATPDSQPLFAGTDPLAVTIVADFTALDGDRSESPDRPAVLVVGGDDGARVQVPAEIRTRGSFRLDPANCTFPPLRIDIDGDAARGTPFEDQDDLKLVSSCRPGRDSWEELIHSEYLAYRIVQAVTDASFRVRLLEATFVDAASVVDAGDVTNSGDVTAAGDLARDASVVVAAEAVATGGAWSGSEDPVAGPRVAFLIEEDEALARRLGATVFDLEEGKNLSAVAFDPISRMTDAVAQYMLGNPDWSDVAGHNVEILDRGGVALAVPYDFDFSGLVDAPYATPPPEYRLESVRERYYRGWCENPLITARVLDRFRDARERVLDIWRSHEALSGETRRRGVRYLEDFFDAVESDERAEGRFLRDCRPLAR
jgi:hypothetical protein